MAAKKTTRKAARKKPAKKASAFPAWDGIKAANAYQKGGTEMWCPACEEITTCTAVPNKEIGLSANPRVYNSKSKPEINWFRRTRQCQQCDHIFVTAEVEEKYIDELCELRNLVSKIKKSFK